MCCGTLIRALLHLIVKSNEIFSLQILQKAALSLREPYFLKAPSAKLSGKDRAAIVAKELNEFLGHYRRETECFTVFKEEQGMVPRHTFEEFIAFANDSDLEDVLTLQVSSS